MSTSEVTSFVLGDTSYPKATHPIDAAQFWRLKSSASAIVDLWEYEHLFEIFALAYVDLEGYMLSLALDMKYQGDDVVFASTQTMQRRCNLDLKVISFLTASRIFEEQGKQRVQRFRSNLGLDPIKLDELFSEQFESSFEYRVIHALRNYSLHSQPPVHLLSYKHSLESEAGKFTDGNSTRTRVTVEPTLSIDQLVDDEKIRKKTRQELSDLGYTELDLKFYIRGFVQCISAVRNQVHQLTHNELSVSLKELELAESSFWDIHSRSPVWLSVWRNVNGKKIDDTLVWYEHFRFVAEARKKWRGLATTQRNYISSELTRLPGKHPNQSDDVWVSQ